MPFLIPALPYIAAGFAIISAGIAIYSIFNPPKPSTISFGSQGDLGGSPRYGSFFLDNTTTNELAVPILYGRLKVAGNTVWQSEAGLTINKIIGVCEGEICGLSDIRANDLLIANGEEAPGCSATAYVGTNTQTADSRVPTVNSSGDSLSANMNLRNLAYLSVTLASSDQLKGGNPTITSIGAGKKIKTWQGGVWSTGDSFSRNPAAIIRDVLTNERYGLGMPVSALDDATFGAAYDYCEEIIAT
jgi:hypothetical protein